MAGKPKVEWTKYGTSVSGRLSYFSFCRVPTGNLLQFAIENCHRNSWFSHQKCWFTRSTTWWLIPLSKWVITPVISGLTLLIPFITGVITHLLSGMSHQAGCTFLRLVSRWRDTSTIPASSGAGAAAPADSPFVAGGALLANVGRTYVQSLD